MPQIIHKDWDINEHATGRFHKDLDTGLDLPIIGATFQNGLNDIEPDGSFVPCDMGLDAVAEGVTTHRVKRGRYGELRFVDTASANKHLCKIKYKNGNGRSLKYTGDESGLPDVSNGRPSFTSNNGVIIEHTPTYKGVRIELVINDPLTAPIEYPFSMKDYGQSYTDEEVNGGIVSTGEDGKKIIIHAPYAIDANGDVGPVSMVLTDVIGNLQTFKKVVDETWLRQAVAPVRIDPEITIEHGVDGGIIEDCYINGNPGGYTVLNNGAHPRLQMKPMVMVSFIRVGLTAFNNIIVMSAKFGIDVYQNSGILTTHRMLKHWGEGNKVNAPATAGESSWLCYAFPDTWTTPGGHSDGNDRQAIAESSISTGVNHDCPINLTSAAVQDDIDNPENNHGYGIYNTAGGSVIVKAASNESTGYNIPYFYMEYTEGAEEGGWHPNSCYGNRKIRGDYSPQRSRRTH